LGDSRKYPYPYHGQHLGIPRERGVSWTAWGVSALNFQRENMAKASLEIAFQLTFLVCKSSTT